MIDSIFFSLFVEQVSKRRSLFHILLSITFFCLQIKSPFFCWVDRYAIPSKRHPFKFFYQQSNWQMKVIAAKKMKKKKKYLLRIDWLNVFGRLYKVCHLKHFLAQGFAFRTNVDKSNQLEPYIKFRERERERESHFITLNCMN